MTPCGADSQRFCASAPDTKSQSSERSEANARPLPRPTAQIPGAFLHSQRQRHCTERVPQRVWAPRGGT
jgi:hypothetical protein